MRMDTPKDKWDELYEEMHDSSDLEIETDADDLDIPYTHNDDDCTPGYGILNM